MLASSSSTSFLQHPLPLALSSRHQPQAKPSFLRFRPHKTVAAACSAATETGQAQRPHLNFPVHQMASAASLYEVLGIPMSASCHDIKTAYRRLARMCHPDVVAINQKEASANDFKKIHAAYCTLSDPDKRACYDREIYGYRRRPYGSSPLSSSTVAMAGFPGRTRRNWETDQCW
ncbi:chaperone protein dnaJ 11, chloroplastic-like [Juglans microcarpa x Juglans regia]|uniref:chaperone protein dnaJ 11, chloroplastic-like n=1 Tax=Juglans microcarpa x Juglans regia TaxID=2249226 RepID=UPI001B7E87C3|nr:chaperone protein dnaJ 11, chloroplastic-like [Juglans microcarpa x Juglans regia]